MYACVNMYVKVHFANYAVYCMSKGALSQYTRAAAVELAPKGVRVNAVCPGYIRTDIDRDLPVEVAAKLWEFVKTLHPIGRVGKPEEIAPSVVFLASNKASAFTTGACLYIDGARTAAN